MLKQKFDHSKSLLIMGIFSILTCFNIEAYEVSSGANCSGQSVQCSVEMIPQMKLDLQLEKQGLKERYNNVDFSNVNPEELNQDINAYLSKANELRDCERQLELRQTSCNLELRSKKELSETLFVTKTEISIGPLDNSCQKRRSLNLAVIENTNGVQIAQSLLNKWNISQNVACQTHSNPIEQTERSFVIAGYRQSDQKNASISIIDWTNGDGYQVSQHWSRLANLRSAKLDYKVENDNVVFFWDNGATITLDGQTGQMIDSNIIDPKTYQAGESCRTKTRTHNGRIRFYPEFILQSPYKDTVRISTVRG